MYRTALLALLPQLPFLGVVARRNGDAVRDKIGGRGFAFAFVDPNAGAHLLAFALGFADLSRQFDADQVRLAVKIDEVVDDLAHFVLHPHDGRIAHLRLPARLVLVLGRWQPIEYFAGWPLAEGKAFVAPFLAVRTGEQSAETLAFFQFRQEYFERPG